MTRKIYRLAGGLSVGLIVFVSSMLLAGCMQQSPTPTATPTIDPATLPTRDIYARPTAKGGPVLPTKVVEIPSTPTPPDVERLFPGAGQLCNDAFSSTVREEALDIPVLAVKGNTTYHDDKGTRIAATAWQLLRLDSLEQMTSSTPEEVRALVCVKQTSKQVGCYTETGGVIFGSPAALSASCIMAPGAYQLHWDVRVVRLPQKEAIGSTSLVGGDPPKSITMKKAPFQVYIPGTGGAAGSEPTEDLIRWIQEKRNKP